MPKSDARRAIVESAMNGVYAAARDWFKMSGLWLWEAPEYFATARIAQTLAKELTSAFICLEWNIQETLSDARRAPKRGRPADAVNGAKRFDVVVFYGQTGRPRAAIEVKHRFITCNETLAKDFDRLMRATAEVQEGSSLSLGCLVVYLEQGPSGRNGSSPTEEILRKHLRIREWAVEQHAASPKFSENVKLSVDLGPIRKESKAEDSAAYGCVVITLEHVRKRIAS